MDGRKSLRTEAVTLRFQKAVELKPDDHQAYDNWGTGLLNLAKTQTGCEAEALYRQALEKFQKAVDLGGKSYNLACTYALMQDKDNALLYLNRSLEINRSKPNL